MRSAASAPPRAANQKLNMPAELTSRERTERVNETEARPAARQTSKEPEPLDVVLASNLISVGLEVDRLPKTPSEYIQATSRVGRSYPGLVVTCMNVGRPRDRSHYERFVAYLESFYWEVEATSVTPFSGQALDRGLVGSLISMLRHGLAELEPPLELTKLHDHREEAERILAWMVTRAGGHRNFDDDEAERRIADLVRARGRSFLDAWERVVDKARDGGAARTYSRFDRAGHQGLPILFTANDELPHHHDERWFQAPTSMRDVEPSVHIWLRYAPLDERK